MRLYAVAAALGIIRHAEQFCLQSRWRGCCLVVCPQGTHVPGSSSLCKRVHRCAGASDHGSRVADVAQGAVHGADIEPFFLPRAHALSVNLRRVAHDDTLLPHPPPAFHTPPPPPTTPASFPAQRSNHLGRQAAVCRRATLSEIGCRNLPCQALPVPSPPPLMQGLA